MTKIIIEPLARHHDRAAFDSGVPRVDNFIRLTARKHIAEDLAVVRVAVAKGEHRVLGYHSLSAHSLAGEDLPKNLVPKGRPYPGIGAFYLGFIGVQQSLQGRGLGQLLLRDAMHQTVLASTLGGVAFLVLDALDEERVRFYTHLGFVRLPSNPLRLVLSCATIRAALNQHAQI
jgi:GNAT superfamily N-acetyltransferase